MSEPLSSILPHLDELQRAREELLDALGPNAWSLKIRTIAVAFRSQHAEFATLDAYHALVGGSLDASHKQSPQEAEEIVVALRKFIRDALHK